MSHSTPLPIITGGGQIRFVIEQAIERIADGDSRQKFYSTISKAFPESFSGIDGDLEAVSQICIRLTVGANFCSESGNTGTIIEVVNAFLSPLFQQAPSDWSNLLDIYQQALTQLPAAPNQA